MNQRVLAEVLKEIKSGATVEDLYLIFSRETMRDLHTHGYLDFYDMYTPKFELLIALSSYIQ